MLLALFFEEISFAANCHKVSEKTGSLGICGHVCVCVYELEGLRSVFQLLRMTAALLQV